MGQFSILYISGEVTANIPHILMHITGYWQPQIDEESDSNVYMLDKTSWET